MSSKAFQSLTTNELVRLLVEDRSREIISELRNDPITFLVSNNWSEEDFLCSVCKILQTKDVELSLKLELLIVIQEHSTEFLTSHTSLEEYVEIFRNILKMLRPDVQHILKSQLLVTITNMLLSFEDCDQTETFGNLLLAHYNELWSIICDVNNKNNCPLREVVCECILEIETLFPCLGFNHLDDFYNLCQAERLYVFQNYVNLIVCIIKNAAISTPDSLIRTNEISKRLKNVEILTVHQLDAQSTKLKKIITEMLDLSPLLSVSSMEYVVSNIQSITKQLQLNPLIFKTFIHRYAHTMDLTLFHLVITLKGIFRQDLFSKQEELHLLHLLFSKPNHCALSANQRLIVLGWIPTLLQSHTNRESILSFMQHKPFIPLPWDLLDVRERKLFLLIDTFHHFEDQDSHNGMLMKHIEDVYSEVSWDFKRYIPFLLRLLHHCHQLKNVQTLDSTTERIVLGILKHFPNYSLHLFHFFKNIKHLDSLSEYSSNLLYSCIHLITSGQEAMNNYRLNHYLQFLSEAAKEDAECSHPKAIVFFLKVVLKGRFWDEVKSDSSKWLMGHSLLNICKSIICNHNSNSLFVDIGQILYVMITHYGDIDVRDRALFYYMLLTTLSPRKIFSLLHSKPAHCLNSPITENSTVEVLTPVLHLDYPVLKLERVVNSEDEVPSYHMGEFDGTVEHYHQWLFDFDVRWCAKFYFNLQMEQGPGRVYNELYGIELSFHGPECYGIMPNIHILSLSKEKDVRICLSLHPLKCFPGSIDVSAIFSTGVGQTCFSKLPSIKLDFADFFQPLPVPRGITSSEIWRQELANHLWSCFLKDEQQQEFHNHQSVLRLLCNDSIYKTLYSERLTSFITNKEDLGRQPAFMVGVFLPPKTHLIMKLRLLEDQSTMISFVTEDVDVLFHVNLYFSKLEETFQL